MGVKLLLVLAFVAGLQAGPISERVSVDTCARQCTVSSKFNYEAGTTYEFEYETELQTSVDGASEDHSGLHMTAMTHMEFLSKCEVAMTLTDVTLKEYEPETKDMKVAPALFRDSLQQNPLRFSYQDGTIEEICVTANEPTWVLNIKRGIVSVFQIGMDDMETEQKVTETDVSGNCEANYTSADKGWYNTLIKKSKNLLGCRERQGQRSAIQGTPYTSQSDIQSLPLVKSTHECEHEVVKSTGQLQKATCTERHMFAPFSRKSSGAVTKNSQKLTFMKQTNKQSKQVPFVSRGSLKFEHAYDADKEASSQKDLERKLMEVCQNTKSGVRPETPSLFTSLVKTMKTMDANDMTNVYQKIMRGSICSDNKERVSKFFLDSIPMAGTTESLKLMTQMITSKDVTGIDADMWLTTLNFIQSPTLDMLTEVRPLLSIEDNEAKAMLSVSSLVHSYCRSHGDCENTLEVRKIINLLQNKIGSACKVTDANMNTVLIALRAIGNAGYGTNAIPVLSKCIGYDNNPIEVRLSAVEAFRRIPCDSDKHTIMNLFTDTTEDSELRIAAYRVLMECPTPAVLSKVKLTLGREEVNQVGSYVWSHLTNLMETSDPHKQDIRAILEDETLQKEFDMDKRKFSRNYEGSVFIEKLNTGATLEGDLIWSTKSFIPRSAMVNLTVDLFGSAVNLFEIGGRVEGLEYFLESYFGPNGYFSENDVQAAADESALKTIKLDKAKRITKRMESVMDELKGSLYMRVFGNEMRYMHFHGLDSLRPTGDSFNFLEMLLKLSKDNDYTFTQSATFLDSSIIIPTGSGFPMNLTVDGTATIDVKASGKMDMMKMSASPPSIDIHGMIRPSGAVEITSMMSVDAFVTKAGIKMVSTLHSSTSVQGKVELAEGKILNVEFDLPDEKMDIISVKSSFFTVHRDLEREQKMITENRKSKSICSGDKLAHITGIELCGELQFPNASLTADAPYFPITGPVSMGISLVKRDSLTGYKLQARSTHTGEENIVRLAFSTPESKINRNFGVDLNMNRAKGLFDASFTSPWKNGDFKGTVTNTNGARGVTGKLNWDNTLRYDVNALLQSESSGPGMLYKPTLQIRVPGGMDVALTGSVKASVKMFDVDLSLQGLKRTPVTLKAALINKPTMKGASALLGLGKNNEYSFEANLQTTMYNKKATFNPHVSVRTPTGEVLAFGGGVQHIFGKKLQIDAVLDKIVTKPISLKGTFAKKELRRGRSMYNVKLDMRSWPVDLKLNSKFDKRNWKAMTSNVDLTYVIRQIARNNVKLATKLINYSTKSLTKARCSVNMDVKRNPELNFKMTSNLNHNKKHSEIDVDFRYGANDTDAEKQVNAALSMDRTIRSWESMSVAVSGQFRKGNDLRIAANVAHKHDRQDLSNSMSLKLNKNTIDSNLRLTDKTADLLSMTGEYALSYPGRRISIEQIITEVEKNKYTSTMTAQIGKSKNTIVTKWTKPSTNALSLTSSISISTMEPIVLEGDYNFKPHYYSVSGLIQNGASKYSTKLLSQIDLGNTVMASADIEYPNRHIITSFEGTKIGDKYTSRTDMRWNAEKDDTDRLTINTNGVVPSPNNIDGSITIQYPSRTIALNLKHTAGNKYVTHADFQWESGKAISVDTSYSSYTRIENREMVGSVKLRTPFRAIRSLDLTMNHQIDDDKYKSKLDVEWNPSQIVSATVMLKRPITLSSVYAEVKTKTPLKSFKTAGATFSHKNRNGISTLAKINWNKQSMQADVSLSNMGTSNRTNIKGQIDIKTTFRNLKIATVSVSHKSDGRSIESVATYIRNKRSYSIASEMNHDVNEWAIKNNGKIIVSTPSNSIQTIWDHSSTLRDITSSATTTWDDKRISVNYNGHQDFSINAGSLSSRLEIQTPFQPIQDIVFLTTHEHSLGQIDSNMKISNDGSTLLFGEGSYKRKNGQVTSQIVFTNPLFDGDTSVRLNCNYEKYPTTGHMEIRLSPENNIVIDGSFDKDNAGNIDTSLQADIPYLEPISLNIVKSVKENGITSRVRAEYATGQVISLEFFHRLDSVKHIEFTLLTPFTQRMTSQVKFQPTRNAFSLLASIDAQPFIKPWSLTGSLGTSLQGVSGNLRINTPYPEHSYSQISVDSAISNGPMRSVIRVEYKPRSEIRLLSVYNLGDLSDMDITVTLTTPFTRDISGTFSHSGSWNKFQTNGQMTYEKSIGFGMKHEGSLKDFRTGIEVTINGSKYSLNGKSSYEPKFETIVTLSTPLADWNNMRLSHSLDGSAAKFTNTLAFVHSSLGTYSSEVSLNTENTLSGEAHLQTPITGYRNMRAAASFDGSWRQFHSTAELQNGNSTMTGDMKLNTDSAIAFEATLETPFKSIELAKVAVSHDGDMKAFKSHVETQLNRMTSEIDLVFNAMKKIDADLSVRTSFMQPLKVSLDHWGSWKKFTTKLRARQGNQRASSEIRLQLSPTLNFIASLKTPFQPLKNQQLSVKHAGTRNSFKCNMQYRMNGDVYIGDASLENTDTLRTELNLNGPGFRPIGVLVSHEGILSNFQNSAEMSYGKNKIQVETALNAISDISGKIAIASPFAGMESINIAMSHAGQFNNFKSHGEVNYGNNTMQADALFDITNDITASLRVSSPYTGYEDISASVRHTGTVRNFHTEAMYKLRNKQLDGMVSFNSESEITCSASIKSTFAVIDNCALTFIYQGQSDSFKTHGEMTLGKYTTEADVVLDLTNGIDGTVTAKLPMMRDTVISIKHTTSPSSISSQGNILYGGLRKFNIQSDFNTDMSVGGRVKIITPFEGYEDSEVSVNHDGTMKNFRSQAELVFRNERHEVDMSFTTIPDIEGRITASSPLFETVQTTISHSGTPTNFKSAMKCTYGRENILQAEAGINMNGPFSGDFSITSPFVKSVEASFNHDRQINGVNSRGKLVYGGKISQGSVILKMNNDFDMAMSLTTPCMKHIALTFVHNGPIRNCRTTADISYGDASQFNLISNLNTESDIEGEIKVASTIPGFSSLEGSIRHTGTNNSFRSHGDISVEGNDVNGDIYFSPNEGMLKLKSPFTNDIGGNFLISGHYPAIQTQAGLSYGSKKLIDFSGNMHAPMNGDISLDTPISGFEHTFFAVKHTGNNRTFDSHAEIVINGVLSEGDISVNTVDMLKGSMSLRSPLITPIAVNAEYTKGGRSEATISYGNDKHTATFNRNTIDRYDGQITVSSPLMKELTASIDSNADIYQLDSSAEVRYGGSKLVGFGISTDTVNTLSGSVSVSIPSNTAQFTVNIDGTSRNFKCHSSLTINDKPSELEVAFNSASDVVGSISVRSPVTRHHVAKFNINGKPTKFQFHIEASCDSEKSEADVSVNVDEGLDLKISFTTPTFPPTSIAVSFNGHQQSFRSHAELNIDDTKHELDITMESENSVTGSIMLRSPMLPAISANMDYSGDVKNFQTHAEVNIDTMKHEMDASLNTMTDIAGHIAVRSPLIKPVSSHIEYSGEPRNFKSHVELNIDTDKHEIDISLDSYNKIESAVSLKSPAISPVSFILNHKGTVSDFQSMTELTTGTKKYGIDATFKMENEISGRLVAICPYSQDLTVTFNTNTALPNIKSKLDVLYGHQKKVDIDLVLNTDSSLSGSIAVIVPGNRANAVVSIQGVMNDFSGETTISLNDQAARGEITFSSTDKITGRAAITLPETTLELVFDHEGNISNFASSATFVTNGNKTEGKMSLNIETSAEGHISFTSPMNEDIKASFKHSGPVENFRSHAAVSYGQIDIFNGIANLRKVTPVQGSVQIQTPIPGYESVSAEFTHEMGDMSFKNHAEIAVNGEKTEGDVFADIGSKLEGGVSAKSPYFPEISSRFDVTGNPTTLNAYAEFLKGSNKYSADASISTISGIEGTIAVTTPVTGMKNVVGKMTHTGAFPNFNTLAHLKVGRRTLGLFKIHLSNTSGIDGQLTVQSPFSPSVQASINHKGHMLSFNSNAEISINGQKSEGNIAFTTVPAIEGSISGSTPFLNDVAANFKIDVQSEFNAHAEGRVEGKIISVDLSAMQSPNMEASVNVKTPFTGYENMKGAIKFTKTHMGFSSHAEMELSPSRKIEFDGESSWRSSIEGSISIKTPFEGFRESRIQTNYVGTFPNIRSDIVVHYQRNEYAAHASLQHQTILTNGKVTITTPFAGYERLGITVNRKGDAVNCEADAQVTYATGYEMSAVMSKKVANQHVESKMVLKTPYTEVVTYEHRYTTILTDLSSDLLVSVGAMNSLSLKTIFKIDTTSMALDSKMSTVISGSPTEQRITLQYDGTPTNFKSSAFASIFGSAFSTDASFQAENNIEGKVSVKTPFEYVRDVALSVEHSGNSRRFSTKTEIQYELGKKIESTVQYVKYGWRRLQTSVDIRTPFAGYERNRMSYRHTASVDSFECDADINILNKELTGNLRASKSPISASLVVNTPFHNFEQIGADFKLDYDSESYNTEANVVYMQGKTVSLSSEASVKTNPISAVLTVNTPFVGYEQSEMQISHAGNLRNFHSIVSANIPFVSPMRTEARLRSASVMDMDGSWTFTSQMRNWENIKLTMVNKIVNPNLDNSIELAWAPSKSIAFSTSIHGDDRARTSVISLTTPFDSIKEVILKTNSKRSLTTFSETIYAQFNGKPIYDIDIDMEHGVRKSGSMLMRSPRPIHIQLSGSLINGKYEGDGFINMNTQENGHKARFEGSVDTFNGNIFTFTHSCPGVTMNLNGAYEESKSHAEFSYNGIPFGYEMVLNEQDGRLKVKLPRRSLQISGSRSSRATEGAFMWDADRDERKTVGFRSAIVPTDDSMKADITLMLPVIGKDVQLDSEVTLNRGRLLFDVKTELTYSKDSRKKFTLASRLEDVSNGVHSKNYSFSISVSHPHTSVGVELQSHIARSDEKLTGSVDMKYLTVRRETKSFIVNGEINKLRRNVNLNVNTPVKRISIDGQAQLDSPFRVNVASQYDKKRTLNTMLSVNPATRMVDFQMNYDIDNPTNEFHLNAKYVNSSAIAAEMFRVVNRQKITDALMTVRLSSPRLLNTRLHWRPSMINDLKDYQQRKVILYKDGVRSTMDAISSSVRYEMQQKARMISDSAHEEAEPVVALYDNNDYHIKDITDAVIDTVQTLRAYNEAMLEYLTYLNDEISRVGQETMMIMQAPLGRSLRDLESVGRYLNNKSSLAYGKLADGVNKLTRHQVVSDATEKLVFYANKMRAYPVQTRLNSMSDRYTSGIYNAREMINTRLAGLMSREDVKTVMQQGSNAYRYWEVRDHAEAIYQTILNWLKSEIEMELSEIMQTIQQYEESMVTVYDPAHGEIQLKTYLPIPLKSLDVVPTIDMAPLLTKVKRLVPKKPSISMPGLDVSTWLPPHQAVAVIEGDRVTTFDGLTYDLTGTCTYILAKDFVDGNFSLALRRDGEPTLMIMADGQAVEITANATVRVNNVPVALPTKINRISITSAGGVVTVDGAGNFNIEYASDLDRYIIRLSGWYYGKISGILGTYDNEPSNDFMTSFGRQINTVDRFTRTWDIGTAKCR